ncbi:hypothetical protein N7527_003285 [Penicillium freii]|nr:hypothetical protein N7527_003285 [Penicillium freii]
MVILVGGCLVNYLKEESMVGEGNTGDEAWKDKANPELWVLKLLAAVVLGSRVLEEWSSKGMVSDASRTWRVDRQEVLAIIENSAREGYGFDWEL